MHKPVLLHEVVRGLNLKRGSVVVDGTLGLGGHAREIIKHILPNGLLIGIDQDPRNLKKAKENLKEFSKNIKFVQGNFSKLSEILKNLGIEKVDAILLDLGLSSPHIDEADRGFSYIEDGPLDMRMNPESSVTAAEIVNTYKERELANLIYKYGEEKHSRKIANIIVKERERKKFTTTRELATVLEREIKNKHKHPALLTFQALRIAVNDELDVLISVLKESVELLSSGGCLAVISYHSLEDRIVKQFIREQARVCICPKELPLCSCNNKPKFKIITKKPIVPSEEEVKSNNRSRSAKLRIAERI